MLMSALAEEKGGKSEKMPTLIAPALAMSSTASALACVVKPKPVAPSISMAAMDDLSFM